MEELTESNSKRWKRISSSLVSVSLMSKVLVIHLVLKPISLDTSYS